VPAAPNGIRGAFTPDPFAGVLHDLSDRIRFPDRHGMNAPHQAKAARRMMMFSEYAERTQDMPNTLCLLHESPF
jgi:hypothetical protein